MLEEHPAQATNRPSWKLLICGVIICTLAGATQGDRRSEKHEIRLKFEVGQQLTYRLRTQGELVYTPRGPGMNWFDGESELVFTLKGETEREHGGGTYEFTGKQLESVIKSPHGKVKISVDDTRMRVSRRGTRRHVKRDSPFEREMSVTLGPRFSVRKSRGLGRIWFSLATRVGHWFWHLVYIAPEPEVRVGDKWDTELKVRLPDTSGPDLKVKADASVTGWKTVKKRKCLVIAVKGNTTLDGTTITFHNGNKLRVRRGSYQTKGKAYWDVERGVPVLIEANTTFDIESDNPKKQEINAHGSVELRLLSSKQASGGRSGQSPGKRRSRVTR